MVWLTELINFVLHGKKGSAGKSTECWKPSHLTRFSIFCCFEDDQRRRIPFLSFLPAVFEMFPSELLITYFPSKTSTL
jgi:hypothetical protein